MNCNLINLYLYKDLSIDVSKIGTDQANELNSTAHGFGMTTNDFYSFLNNDLEEAENIQLARLAEEEKAMFAVSFLIQIIRYYSTKLLIKLFNYLFFNWSFLKMLFNHFY